MDTVVAGANERSGGTRVLRWVEITVAVLITCVAAALHVVRAMKAGALWRDEIGAVNLAQLPSLGAIAANLHHEAFPIFFSIVLRGYSFATGGSDTALRVFGLLIGLSFLAAVWIAGRAMHGGVPLISVALLGTNASMILWVDWVRGHGLGIVLMLATVALVWKLATRPSLLLGALALISALCAVQTLYYNAVLLLAVGLGGAAVALRKRYWKAAAAILSIGALAALSLVPYLQTSRRAAESSLMYALPEFPLSLFWIKLREALASTGAGLESVWVAAVVLAITVAVVVLLRRASSLAPGVRDRALYCLIILLVSIPGYFGLLRLLRYPTQPWYYIALMAATAVVIDGCLSNVARGEWTRIARIAAAAAITGWTVLPAWSAIQVRQTNMDLVARTIAETAGKDDLVVVLPWYFGVTFERYYRGAAPWTTVPPIAERKLQRYDLLKQQMRAMDPLAPVTDAMTKALLSGNRVWLVGQLFFPDPDQIPPVLAPAPYDPAGWSEGAYQTSWNLRTTHFLQTRAGRAEEVPLNLTQPVNAHENARVVVLQGWRSSY